MKLVSGFNQNPYSRIAQVYPNAEWNVNKVGLEETKKMLDTKTDIATRNLEDKYLEPTRHYIGIASAYLATDALTKGNVVSAVAGLLTSVITLMTRKTFGKIAQKIYDAPGVIANKLAK